MIVTTYSQVTFFLYYSSVNRGSKYKYSQQNLRVIPCALAKLRLVRLKTSSAAEAVTNSSCNTDSDDAEEEDSDVRTTYLIEREPRGVSLAEKRTNFPLYDIVRCIR